MSSNASPTGSSLAQYTPISTSSRPKVMSSQTLLAASLSAGKVPSRESQSGSPADA